MKPRRPKHFLRRRWLLLTVFILLEVLTVLDLHYSRRRVLSENRRWKLSPWCAPRARSLRPVQKIPYPFECGKNG